MRAFEALNFGIIGINDINPTSAEAPFGGMSESGLGQKGVRQELAEYLETKLGGCAHSSRSATSFSKGGFNELYIIFL
jgi:succinate-semialdehyde dehydrogenase/glutarate-semialdehyde dehydrogenase